MQDSTVELEPELAELAGDCAPLAELLDNIAGVFKNFKPAQIREIIIRIAGAGYSARGQELQQKLIEKLGQGDDFSFLHLCELVSQKARKMVD